MATDSKSTRGTPIPPPARTGPIVRRPATRRLAEVLEEMRATTDDTDTDASWEGVFRGIDEGRPHRKLFEGRY
jgi:hypothetical protein